MGNPIPNGVVAAFPLRMSATPFPPPVTEFGGLTRVLDKDQSPAKVQPVGRDTGEIVRRIGADITRPWRACRRNVELHDDQRASLLRFQTKFCQAGHEMCEPTHQTTGVGPVKMETNLDLGAIWISSSSASRRST